MKNIYQLMTRNLEKVLLYILILFNITYLFIAIDVIWLNILSIVILVSSLYLLNRKINQYVITDHIGTSIRRISELILKVESKDALYQSILEEILSHVSGADKGSLITIDEHGDLTYEAVVGFNFEATKNLKLRFEDTYLFKAIDQTIPKSIVIDNIGLKNRNYLNNDNLEAMEAVGTAPIKTTICVPISFNKKLFGIINIDSVTKESFERDEIELIEHFSDEVTKVIQLYKFSEQKIKSSKYDQLTELHTYGSFKTEASHYLKTHPHPNVLTVYYNLKNIKTINHDAGFDVGDAYIQHFSKGIRKHLYGKELFARLGGGEFILMFLRPRHIFDSFDKQCQIWFNDHPFTWNNTTHDVAYHRIISSRELKTESIDAFISDVIEQSYKQT